MAQYGGIGRAKGLEFAVCLCILFTGIAATAQSAKYIENGNESTPRYGFADREGKLVIPFNYVFAGPFSEGLAMVGISRKQAKGYIESPYSTVYGFIDKSGKTVIPCIYNEVTSFSEGLAMVKGYKKNAIFVNCIDTRGKEVAQFQSIYEIGTLKNNLAPYLVEQNKAGFIDGKGSVVIPAKFVRVRHFSEGLAAVVPDFMDWGFIDKSGSLVIKGEYSQVSDFSEGLAGVTKYFLQPYECKLAYINANNDVVIPYGKYIHLNPNKEIRAFSEGLVAVCRMGEDGHIRYGFADRTGTLVVPCIYSAVRDFHEGLASVDKGKWGFIDKKGNEVVPCKYDEADDFSEGMAAVAILQGWTQYVPVRKWGYINKKGDMVIPMEYSHAFPMKEGMAVVRKFDYKMAK